MINLEIKGVCEDCKHINLKLYENDLFCNSLIIPAYYIRCTHDHVCGRLLQEQSEEAARLLEV